MKIHFVLFLSLLFSSLQAPAQGVYKALQTFVGTEFFDDYLECRNRAEDAVRRFDLVKHKYAEADVQVVIDAYNSSAEYFNMTLHNIKNDLLHKDKRQYMLNFSDSYAKEVETDLRRAQEFYEETFQKEVANLTEGEITGTAFLALLPDLIKYTKLGIEVIKRIKSEVNKFNESLLNQYLIEPYRFRTWDEITSSPGSVGGN